MNRRQEIEDLKKKYYELAEKFTPEEIKKSSLIDLTDEGEIKLVLNKEMVEKLKLEDWLANYEKEAKVSTAGIRGSQNIFYYWDTRFPINQIGVALATLGKSLVLKDEIKGREIHKITAGEVRYNTQSYIDLISRIQSAFEIYTHLPFGRQTVPVWMVSFLIFMLDYDGGEYVTSSHAISSKTATKDLDNEGNAFLPEMSLKFIEKIKEIIRKAKEKPDGYTITISPKTSKFILEDFNGYDMYVDYLRKNVAKEANIKLIKSAIEGGFKLMYDVVGGCMYKSMTPILKKLEILGAFDWRNKEEDPFFHGIGKTRQFNPKTNKEEFFDASCDFCLMEVVRLANFEEDLRDKPVGYVVLITDPDGDRLVVGQVESADRIKAIEDLGVNYIKIANGKIFSVYNPTHSFFLIMDFYMKQLKAEGVWGNHPRFNVVTAPSSKIWNEWAKNNDVKVITTPVGMKEIAAVVKKVENQIIKDKEKEVIIEDIFGNEINLGKDPRMVFGGEESGGMITGLEDFVESNFKKRKAMAMRQKSAGEASIIATALAAYLFKEKKLISDYLDEIFKKNNIKSIYYERADIIYYNESEPDPIKLRKEKEEGEFKRDKTDTFYMSLALALRDKKITIVQAREILGEAMSGIDFLGMTNILFTGDAPFFQFDNNFFVQVRRSGTDAKMRGYAGGPDRKKCLFYLDRLLHYDGARTTLYEKIMPDRCKGDIYQISQKIYQKYLYKGL